MSDTITAPPPPVAYPARPARLARVALDAAETALRNARDRLDLMRDDNRRHLEELARVRREAGPGGLVITAGEAARYSSSPTPDVVYRARPGQDDPSVPPWNDDELAAAGAAVEVAEAEHEAARKAWQEAAALPPRGVVAECVAARTSYFWTRDLGADPETMVVRGDPLPLATILGWKAGKLEGLIAARIVGQLPAGVVPEPEAGRR